MAILNIFIDESGSFDFTPKGSKYFILTALAASDCPTLFSDFIELHCSHACFSIDSVIAQKNKVNPEIREDAVFYAKLLRISLRRVFRARAAREIDRINIWAARIGTHKKKAVFEKTVKSYLAHNLETRVPYQLLIHGSASHPLLQIADYCCWAVAKKWKDRELRPYRKIERALNSELEVFRRGATEYY